MRVAWTLLGALLILALGETPAYAQDMDLRADVPVVAETQPRRRLAREFVLALPLWIPGFDGSTTVGDVTLTTDDGDDGGLGILDELFDIVTELEFAFSGAAMYRHDRWFGAVDMFHVRVGNAITFTIGEDETDATLTFAVGRARVGYRVSRHATRWGSAQRPFVAEHYVYAGARFWYAEAESDVFGLTNFRRDDLWVDPIVGYRGRLNMRNGWTLLLNADVGGFHVASELTWSLLIGAEYRFNRVFSLTAAWSYLYVRRDVGAGDDRFEIDMLLAGPHLAIAFHF